jgi:serine/threonine protein kinase
LVRGGTLKSLIQGRKGQGFTDL